MGEKGKVRKNQWPLNLEAINKEQGNTKEANKDLYRRRRRAEINILPKTINDIFEFKIKLFDEQGNELNEEDLENDHYDASNILIGFLFPYHFFNFLTEVIYFLFKSFA